MGQMTQATVSKHWGR